MNLDIELKIKWLVPHDNYIEVAVDVFNHDFLLLPVFSVSVNIERQNDMVLFHYESEARKAAVKIINAVSDGLRKAA